MQPNHDVNKWREHPPVLLSKTHLFYDLEEGFFFRQLLLHSFIAAAIKKISHRHSFESKYIKEGIWSFWKSLVQLLTEVSLLLHPSLQFFLIVIPCDVKTIKFKISFICELHDIKSGFASVRARESKTRTEHQQGLQKKGIIPVWTFPPGA